MRCLDLQGWKPSPVKNLQTTANSWAPHPGCLLLARCSNHQCFQHQGCWPRKCWYCSLEIWHSASCKGNTTTWHKVPGLYFFSEHWDSSKTWHRHQEEKKWVPKPSHPVWVQSYLYISVSSTSSKVLNWILPCVKQVIELFGQRVYLLLFMLSLCFKEESWIWEWLFSSSSTSIPSSKQKGKERLRIIQTEQGKSNVFHSWDFVY